VPCPWDVRGDGALWRVPEDVAAEGLDQVPMAGRIAHGLTTVHQPVEAMVAQTVAALLARIAGEGGLEKIRVPGPLVIRRSARLLGAAAEAVSFASVTERAVTGVWDGGRGWSVRGAAR